MTYRSNSDNTILFVVYNPSNLIFHVTTVVNNVLVRFTIDTGAAATQIRQDA